MKLVSDSFDGTGYSNWKRSMRIALSARNKLGFIDGSIPKPDPTDPTFTSWCRCNDMVLSWILGALTRQIGRSVIYSTSAHQMWQELEERYGLTSGAQLFSLHRELNEVTQGNSNIADYFTKLKMLWDDIDALCLIPVCTCGCTCGAAGKLVTLHQNQRVLQFLMGLNDCYHIIRSSILMRSPLPPIGQVYNLLLQDETQREIQAPQSHFMAESASMNVNVNKPQFASANVYKPKAKMQCTYCKKPGHLVEKCYRLHGFPADFKFTKAKKVAAHAVSEETPDLDTSGSPETPVISADMYNQLLSLIKNNQASDNSPSMANFAGNLPILSTSVACLSDLNHAIWIIDSGANDHMCYNKSLFTTLETLTIPLHISLPNGNTVPIHFRGSVIISHNITLDNVLYVPTFTYNLLSVNKLAHQLDCTVSFL